MLYFSLVCCLCTICHGLFVVPLGNIQVVIGRLRSVIVTFPSLLFCIHLNGFTFLIRQSEAPDSFRFTPNNILRFSKMVFTFNDFVQFLCISE